MRILSNPDTVLGIKIHVNHIYKYETIHKHDNYFVYLQRILGSFKSDSPSREAHGIRSKKTSQ